MASEVRHEDYEAVMTALDNMIATNLRLAAGEQRYPSIGGPEDSDTRIADAIETAQRLRKLRSEFEEVASGALMDDYASTFVVRKTSR